VSLLICLKFNFLPIFLLINIILNKLKFRSICFTFLSVIILFFLIQFISFNLVSFFYSEYVFEKIINSFYAYGKDYISGAAGIEFRYWFFSYLFKFIKKYNEFKLEIFIAYTIFFIGLTYSLLYIYRLSDLSVKLFLFVFIVLYFNLSTSLYWYCLIIPFFYVFLFKNEYKWELVLLVLLLIPKFLFVKNYPIYDSALVLISTIFYVFIKLMNFRKLRK